MAQVSRDPFAREELHRARVYSDHATCAWCGNVRTTPTGRKFLHRYWTETDGGRAYAHRGLFCSKGCHDNYSGL